MDELRGRLRECFRVVFPVLTEGEIALASTSSVAAWDSLATINLVTLVEEEFGVRVEPDDLDQLVSFDVVLDYLKQWLRGV